MELSELQHTVVQIKNGGEIIVLNTGALIDAEAEAMLQALHSRSTGGIKEHLGILHKKGAGDFMSNFYVGYGHKSIGDCGSTTIFLEGVSMLAAKAIQDNPLYSGQESSTRYVNFSQQRFIDPTNSLKGKDLLSLQREFYVQCQEQINHHLKSLHPRKKNEDEKSYEKAIKARGFDIARSLLPAGASTNLAWHTNLRQAADKINFLRHHPLKEVKDIAESLEQALKMHHPNSFGHKRYDKTEVYCDLVSKDYFYHDPQSPKEITVDLAHIDLDEFNIYKELFEQRPPKTELPKYLAHVGRIKVEFQLDFGSFRDLQRHRAISQRMPLLTMELGFNPWYTENFPHSLRKNLNDYLDTVSSRIEDLGCSRLEAQYFIPMGYNISNKFTGDLPATIYMVELRDSRFVHPTLQKVAHDIGLQITNVLGITLHVDDAPNRFDVRRGEQDIIFNES